MEDTLYTIEEVADRLKVAKLTVYRWLKSGELKGIKVGGQWRIPQSELMRFVSQ